MSLKYFSKQRLQKNAFFFLRYEFFRLCVVVEVDVFIRFFVVFFYELFARFNVFFRFDVIFIVHELIQNSRFRNHFRNHSIC